MLKQKIERDDDSKISHPALTPVCWFSFHERAEGNPYTMPYENDRPIFICRDLRIRSTVSGTG
jgi:hypothetical protein